MTRSDAAVATAREFVLLVLEWASEDSERAMRLLKRCDLSSKD